jgi:hypothetical protein
MKNLTVRSTAQSCKRQHAACSNLSRQLCTAAMILTLCLATFGAPLPSYGKTPVSSAQAAMATEIYLYDANGNPVLQPGAYIQRNDVFDSANNLIGSLVGTEIVNQFDTEIGYTQDAS